MARNEDNDRDSSRGSSRRESSRDDERSSRGSSREEARGSRRGGRDEEESRGGRSSRSSGSYQYQERSAADTKKRSSQGANDFDKILKDHIKMWKPNDGDNRIRILPPTWKDAKHFGLDIYVHYAVGPDRQSYLCLSKMKGEADPIAEEREIARRDDDEKYAKDLEAKRRVLVYLIDRDHPKDGVQAWSMPWTVDRDIVKVSVDKSNGEVLPIDHPEEGYDIEFEKKGAKDRTEYLGVAIARRSTALGDDAWLDYAMDNPLPDQLNFFDYDHIAKVFGGTGAHKEKSRDRDDHDDKPAGRGRDESPKRGREEAPARRGEPETPTWDSVHAMTGDELEDLIDQEKLDIDPKEAKDDLDLAEWICEEMKIKKVESGRRRVTESPKDENVNDRLRKMREDRDR